MEVISLPSMVYSYLEQYSFWRLVYIVSWHLFAYYDISKSPATPFPLRE
jgi:nicotinamide riboside transporter PnuC